MRLTDEQIGAELRELRDTPSEQFAAELDAWAAEGFPSLEELQPAKRHAGRSRTTMVKRRPLLAGLAGATAVVVLVGISAAVYLHQRDVGTNSATPLGAGIQNELSAPAPDQARTQAGSGAASAVSSLPPAPPNGTPPRNGRPQVQELSAAL